MAIVTVDNAFCKGCELCISTCPLGLMQLDLSVLTVKGHHPAHCVDFDACTGCLSCATMCPDVAITIKR